MGLSPSLPGYAGCLIKTGASSQSFSELLERVYDLTEPSAGFAPLVQSLAESIPFGAPAMHGFNEETNAYFCVAAEKWDQRFIDQYSDYYAGVSPYISEHQRRGVGEVTTCRQAAPDMARTHPEFFHDWALPALKGAGVGVKLLERGQSYASISIDYEHAKAERFDDGLVVFFKTLSPHLVRALALRHERARQRAEGDELTSLLAQSTAPALLLSARRRICWMNAAAENAVAKRRGVSIRPNGVLALERSDEDHAFEHLVSAACQPETGVFGATPNVLRLSAATEAAGPNFITVAALSRHATNDAPQLERLATIERRALVTIRYRSDARAPAEKQLQIVLGLTPAEAKVVGALASDLTPAEIAERLGVATETVRNQLKAALRKTGCRRQGELIRLAASLV